MCTGWGLQLGGDYSTVVGEFLCRVKAATTTRSGRVGVLWDCVACDVPVLVSLLVSSLSLSLSLSLFSFFFFSFYSRDPETHTLAQKGSRSRTTAATMQFGSGPRPGAEDANSKKNVRWHVEPHLSTMRLAVERVIRGDDTTTKIANSYGIPARTLRRYVAHEKMAQSQQKLPDGRLAKGILNPDSDDEAAAAAAAAASGPRAPAPGVPSSAHPPRTATNSRPPLPASSSGARKGQSQPIAIRGPYAVSRALDPRRQQQLQRQKQLQQQKLQRQRQQQQQQQAAAVASASSAMGKRRPSADGFSDQDPSSESFSDFMNPSHFSGGMSTTSPPSSLLDSRFGGADWDVGLRPGTSVESTAGLFGAPPGLGQDTRGVGDGDGVTGVPLSRERSADVPVPAPRAVEKRNRGVSMDIFLEAFGSTPSPGTSLNSNGSRLLLQAEGKRRNRADSRDLLRLAFTDDDVSAYAPPSESFSTQLLRAGLRERARSQGRSDSFDFSAMAADFNEQFALPDSEPSRSFLSHGSLPRSRGNSVWSNDDGDDVLASQLDLAI